MRSKLNICFTSIFDPKQRCVCRFGWIQWPAVQMFFIELIFVFFMTLFLKKIGIIFSASKPYHHSRCSKPILKIQSIYRKNILGKEFSQPICCRYVFSLLHTPKFQIFSTKLNLMVKVIKLFTGVLWKSCSDKFCRKKPMHESLRKTPAQEFSCEFCPIFQNAFFAKHIRVTASAK